MKTKLTLTVNKNIINSAKKLAKSKNVSLSQLFEEVFENEELGQIKTSSQKAADRLLANLANAQSIETQHDKLLLKAHVKGKFA